MPAQVARGCERQPGARRGGFPGSREAAAGSELASCFGKQQEEKQLSLQPGAQVPALPGPAPACAALPGEAAPRGSRGRPRWAAALGGSPQDGGAGGGFELPPHQPCILGVRGTPGCSVRPQPHPASGLPACALAAGTTPASLSPPRAGKSRVQGAGMGQGCPGDGARRELGRGMRWGGTRGRSLPPCGRADVLSSPHAAVSPGAPVPLGVQEPMAQPPPRGDPACPQGWERGN